MFVYAYIQKNIHDHTHMWTCSHSVVANFLENEIEVSQFKLLSRSFSDPAIGLMSRVFANCLGDRGSISGRVIPKTQKLVLDDPLLNAQHYKVGIKGKVEQSREWSSALLYTSV